MQSVWWTRLLHLKNHRPPVSELTDWLKLYTTAFESHLNGNVFGMLSCSVTPGGFPQFLCKYMQIQLCEGMHIHCTQCKDLSSKKHNAGKKYIHLHKRIHAHKSKYPWSPRNVHTHIQVLLQSCAHVSHTYTQIRPLLGLRKMALGDPWQRLWFPVSGLDTATSITNPDLSPATKLKNKNKKK